MTSDQLKLENQLCFPVYAASRLIIREYQPLLEELGITYPQYLVMMILWENDGIPVSDITQALLLNTNTVTPLLQRMETIGLLERQRSKEDERKVIVKLTEKGVVLKAQAMFIPEKLATCLLSADMDVAGLVDLKNKLTTLINTLSKREVIE